MIKWIGNHLVGLLLSIAASILATIIMVSIPSRWWDKPLEVNELSARIQKDVDRIDSKPLSKTIAEPENNLQTQVAPISKIKEAVPVTPGINIQIFDGDLATDKQNSSIIKNAIRDRTSGLRLRSAQCLDAPVYSVNSQNLTALKKCGEKIVVGEYVTYVGAHPKFSGKLLADLRLDVTVISAQDEQVLDTYSFNQKAIGLSQATASSKAFEQLVETKSFLEFAESLQ